MPFHRWPILHLFEYLVDELTPLEPWGRLSVLAIGVVVVAPLAMASRAPWSFAERLFGARCALVLVRAPAPVSAAA
jgi:hypothetical protein